MYKKLISWQMFPHFFLFGSVCLFVLLRIPSLIEPYWYGDEGIYAVIGNSLREGAVLYKDIWDNKPPILYLLYASVNGELVWIKFLSLLFGSATVLVFFKLAQSLLQDRRSVIIATLLFVLLFGLPLLEGNIANAENFMLLPIVSAFYVALTLKSAKSYFIAGILMSFALMTKSVAVFDSAALVFVLFLQQINQRNNVFQALRILISSKRIRVLFVGFFFIPVLVLLYFLLIGAVPELISSTLTNNVDYVGFENHLLFPLGYVLLKVGLLITALGSIYYFRKSLSRSELIILPWMAFALFSMFFSDRPYTHYILMGIIPFSLLLGCAVQKMRILTIVLTILVCVIVMTHFSLYSKNTAYYQNYIAYVFGSKNFREYVAFFDRNSVIDYDIALTMRQLVGESDSIYYWSDSAQLYLLSDVLPVTKYIVAYHNLSYAQAMEKTTAQLNQLQPQYIVSTKSEPLPIELGSSYVLKFVIEHARIYEKRN